MYVFWQFWRITFRPTFDAEAVRRCIAIVRAIQADCLANVSSQSQLVTSQHITKPPVPVVIISARRQETSRNSAQHGRRNYRYLYYFNVYCRIEITATDYTSTKSTVNSVKWRLGVTCSPSCHTVHDSQPFRSRANSLPGANRPIEPWPIRSLAYSLPGPLAPWNFCSRALSLPGLLITSHHIETTDAGLGGLCIREINVYHTNLYYVK